MAEQGRHFLFQLPYAQDADGSRYGKNGNDIRYCERSGGFPGNGFPYADRKCKGQRGKRKRITELIRAYDYKPNALAKGLRETKSRVIGMILVDFVNPFTLHCCLPVKRKRERGDIPSSLQVPWETENWRMRIWIQCANSVWPLS